MAGCFGGGGTVFQRSRSAPAIRSRTKSSVCSDDEVWDDDVPHPAAEALRAGSLAISFSGGGFLLPYFLGVAEVLQTLGVLIPSVTPLAGSSSGSLVVSGLVAGLTPDQLYDSFLESVHDVRKHGSYRRLQIVVQRSLESTLPPDAAARCSGAVTIGITRLFPGPRTRRVSAFTSRDDLVSALLASCHIPRYFNGDMTTTFRGRTVVDGGVTALLPAPHAPHTWLLKVCCFPAAHISKLPLLNRARTLAGLSHGITPDAFGAWPYGMQAMLTAALHPRDDAFLTELRDAGRSDAARWAAAAGVPAAAAALGPGRGVVGGVPAEAVAVAAAAASLALQVGKDGEGAAPPAVVLVESVSSAAGSSEGEGDAEAEAEGQGDGAGAPAVCLPTHRYMRGAGEGTHVPALQPQPQAATQPQPLSARRAGPAGATRGAVAAALAGQLPPAEAAAAVGAAVGAALSHAPAPEEEREDGARSAV